MSGTRYQNSGINVLQKKNHRSAWLGNKDLKKKISIQFGFFTSDSSMFQNIDLAFFPLKRCKNHLVNKYFGGNYFIFGLRIHDCMHLSKILILIILQFGEGRMFLL